MSILAHKLHHQDCQTCTNWCGIWQLSRHHAKPVNFKSGMNTHLTKWSGIQHNWLEIVYCPAVILSSVYVNLIVRFCTATCMNVSASCMNIIAFEHCCNLSGTKSLHFEHDAFSLLYITFHSYHFCTLCHSTVHLCFEHSKFFYTPVWQSYSFNPYLCPLNLNPCKLRPSEGKNQAMKDNFVN